MRASARNDESDSIEPIRPESGDLRETCAARRAYSLPDRAIHCWRCFRQHRTDEPEGGACLSGLLQFASRGAVGNSGSCDRTAGLAISIGRAKAAWDFAAASSAGIDFRDSDLDRLVASVSCKAHRARIPNIWPFAGSIRRDSGCVNRPSGRIPQRSERTGLSIELTRDQIDADFVPSPAQVN